MKLIHISDLHLGRRLNEFSLVEDQQYILAEILRIVDEERPQGVLIAGDVYDKKVPTGEAVAMLDDFLVGLVQREVQVYLISGNHDSPERLAFGGRLMEHSGVHIAPVYQGSTTVHTMTDEYGCVHIHMLPFVKPSQVRVVFPQADIEDYTDALRTAIDGMQVDETERNVLMTHQFVLGAAQCESEERSIGGTDQVDVSVFEGFDYVALGHLHGPQQVGRESVRYCGTPLKYSVSEWRHKKSLTVVELREKGTVNVRTVALTPKRDLIQLCGTYEQLTFRGYYQSTDYQQSYVHIILKDEEDIPDGLNKLRIIYPYLVKLDYDNRRTRMQQVVEGAQDVVHQTPLELMDEFYQKQHGRKMEEPHRLWVKQQMERIWEGEA